jgi:hypothetical protein
MDRIRQFFYGRYGNDQLNIALLVFAVLLWVVFRMTPVWYLGYVGYVPLAFSVYRSLSKNIDQRRRENEVFVKVLRKLRFWTQKNKEQIHAKKSQRQDKEHKYYKCPSCGAQLRVPKGKGKICITCPKCRKEFIKKT